MGKRFTITESERKQISKLHNLNESSKFSFEEKLKIVTLLYEVIDNWDKYSIDYCNTTNVDEMDRIAGAVCKSKTSGKTVSELNELIFSISGGDPRLERTGIDNTMNSFIDHMNQYNPLLRR